MDGIIRLGYRPLDMYAEAHASTARNRLLVGGMGTGKSMALCADAVSFGIQIPGARILMTRRTIPELRETLEPTFLDILPNELYMDAKKERRGGHLSRLTLPNGTAFLFLSIDDWQKHKSLNLARIYWDELSEFDEDTYNGMQGRIRQVEPTAEAVQAGYTELIPDGVRGNMAATNPNGRSWIWRRWIDKPKDGHAAWTGSSLMNPHLPEDFLAGLQQMPAAWVKRYVFASWDDFGGSVYPEWNATDHIYRARTFDLGTPVWMAMDPGTRHPQGGVWCVVKDRTLIAVAEHLQQGWTVKQHAHRFRAIERQLAPLQVKWRVGDKNSMHVRDRGTQMSLHTQYAREGFHFQNGVSAYGERIPMLGTLIKEGRFKATTRTPQLFEQIRDYKWEDLTPAMKRKGITDDYGPEKPVKVGDDLVDCAQMLSAKLAPSPRDLGLSRPYYRTDWEAESAEIHATLAKQRGRPRNSVDSNEIHVPV